MKRILSIVLVVLLLIALAAPTSFAYSKRHDRSRNGNTEHAGHIYTDEGPYEYVKGHIRNGETKANGYH